MTTRIKEIMVFSEGYIEWLTRYVAEGLLEGQRRRRELRGAAAAGGPIMIFSTEEEDSV